MALNGNTTSSGGGHVGYDFENRLISKNGGALTVLYDGDGNRGSYSTQITPDIDVPVSEGACVSQK